MRTASLLSIGFTTVLCASSLQAQLFFADNFNQVGGTTTDLNTNLAARQSGSYVTSNGTVNWSETSAGSAPAASRDYQNRNNQLQTNLGGTTTETARPVAYLANNLSGLASMKYQATFDLALELFTSAGVPVTSLNPGVTDSRFIVDRTVADLTGSDTSLWDLAARFTPFYDTVNSLWKIRPIVYIAGVQVAGLQDIVFTPQAIGSEFYSPTYAVTFAIDETADLFDLNFGATQVVNDLDISAAFGAGTDRYFAFSANRANPSPTSTGLQHQVDNFALTVVPEPSSAALAAVGSVLLLSFRRRSAISAAN